MKVMLIAFVGIVVIAVGANVVLNNAGFSSQDSAAGAAVRLEN